MLASNYPTQFGQRTMNSAAPGNLSLFTHAASLSMLQNMQNYPGQVPLRQMPNYFISGASLPPLKSHGLVPPPLTPSTNSSLLNARLLSPPSENSVPPPPTPPTLVPPPTASVKLKQGDKVTGEFVETCLQGKNIFAFSVGGEKRLCLPQVLNNVLLCAGATLADINQVCEDLNIFCKRCSPQQMAILKERNVFGPNLENCGLITKSDAERLCKALLRNDSLKFKGTLTQEEGINVYHNCFGKQRGFLIPRLYTSPHAGCIVCNGCSCLFSPEEFVGHAHTRTERETCHWGFDSTNWRRYLLLDKRLTDSAADGCLAGRERTNLEKLLDSIKAKFDRKRQNAPTSTAAASAKRSRTEIDEIRPSSKSSSSASAFVPPPPPIITSGSAKGPLPQQLRQGKSVPVNPESVVLLSQKSSTEHRDFAPNVRLAPAGRSSQQKSQSQDADAAYSDDSIAADWESLIDWGEGHLPEKATPQFLTMVDKVKRGYQSKIASLNTELALLKDQVADAERHEAEEQRLRRQLEELRSPDVCKLRMKYTAQKEEIKHLEADRRRLRSELEAALCSSHSRDEPMQQQQQQQQAKSGEKIKEEADVAEAVIVGRQIQHNGAKCDEDGPPALEMQCIS